MQVQMAVGRCPSAIRHLPLVVPFVLPFVLPLVVPFVLRPQVLQELVARHQQARALVTEEIVDAFMAVRPMGDLFG
jgi:hypothetical protein